MAKMRRHNLPHDLDATHPKDYSAGLKGYGVNVPRIAKVFKGSTFGAANGGRKFTKEEIEAWKRSKRV